MKRKDFLGSLGLIAAGSMISFRSVAATDANEDDHVIRIPAYLKAGDTIGITCPAGFVTAEDVQPAIDEMKSWGYNIEIGSTVGRRDFGFGGTDDERRADLQQMMDNPKIKAIMCARGGYGAVRIVDKLNFNGFAKHPKWMIGFSDITVLHHHLHNLGFASIHSKMTNSFPASRSVAEPIQTDTINSIRDALAGKKSAFTIAADPANINGSGTGTLIGGNLKTIETLTGSASAINTNGKILFVEDTGEYLYSIDRMFWNLKRTGRLAKLKGLIIGGFKIKPDDPGEEFGKDLATIVREKLAGYNYPVCFNFPVGHQKNNYALKCGVVHKLTVNNDGAKLAEV